VVALSDTAWSPAPTLPEPRGEAVTAVLGDAVHIAGGRTPMEGRNGRWRDHADTTAHHRLDRGQWEEAAPCSMARNSGAGAIIKGKLHIVGGRQVDGGNVTLHEVYDPQVDGWQRLSPMPQGQGGLAAAALGETLIAMGGEFFDGDGGVYAQTWLYDVNADAWGRGPDMPTPRHGLGAAVLGDRVYVLGGATGVGMDGTSARVEMLRRGG
jgi:N-acetylneuraminic acid mutarotase